MMTMNKAIILGYVAAIFLPAAIMYGTGYNGTVDALILTVVWILLVMSILTVIMVILAGTAMMFIGVGDKIPEEVKTRMEISKTHLGRWWLTILFTGWMLVALASVDWTGTAITYFIIMLASQISMRLFVNGFNSLEAKLATKA